MGANLFLVFGASGEGSEEETHIETQRGTYI